MIKKIDDALNWILVVLFIAAAIIELITTPVLALTFVIVFIAAVIVKVIQEKKNNIIDFKRKE
jgi:hypothetical protein